MTRKSSLEVRAAAGDGPDIVDVSNFLRELFKVHGITVRFEVTLGPGEFVGCASVTAHASAPCLVGPGKTWVVSFTEGFPSHKYTSLEAVLYRLCHRIDVVAAEELWKQQRFV